MTDIIRDIHRDLIMMNLLKQQYLTTKSSLLKQATLMLPQFFSQISKILTISLGLLKVSQKDILHMVSIWFGDNKSVTSVFLERLISDILFIKEKNVYMLILKFLLCDAQLSIIQKGLTFLDVLWHLKLV